jgi:hypothetical protein
MRISKACWHIEREPFLRAGKEFRSGEEGSIVKGVVGHAILPSADPKNWRIMLGGEITLSRMI